METRPGPGERVETGPGPGERVDTGPAGPGERVDILALGQDIPAGYNLLYNRL